MSHFFLFPYFEVLIGFLSGFEFYVLSETVGI